MTQKSKFEINVRISDVCSAAPFRRQPEHKFVGVQNIAHKKNILLILTHMRYLSEKRLTERPDKNEGYCLSKIH